MASYLNIREAADYLGISPHTLYKLVERSEVPAAKVGGSWRLSPAALDEFLGGKRPSARRSPEVLIIESDDAARRELASVVMSRGARPQMAASTEDALVLLSPDAVPDLVLYSLPADISDAFRFMKHVRSVSPDCRVVLMARPERFAELGGLVATHRAIVIPAPVERPDIVNLIALL